MSSTKPILSLDTLFRVCYELKKQGKRIGLTHGAFDLFHISHLDLLEKTSKLCDFLIVGVESDNSVKKYKYYRRPIVKEQQRMKIISSVYCVDAVFKKDIRIDDSSHEHLYKELGIEILTYGYNFQYEDVFLKRASKIKIEAKKIDTIQDTTTTSIIDRIIDEYTSNSFKPVPKEYL